VINKNSVVHIAVCEGAPDPASPSGITRFRGSATFSISNVHPHGEIGGDGGVEFYLGNSWAEHLMAVTGIAAIDPPDQGSIVG